MDTFLTTLAQSPGSILPALMFYVFAAVLLFSALMVILVRNPVHSVLFLILAFFNASGLMLLMGAEFLAMLLVIVYVGAVAVLFLFVVMMLDIDFQRIKRRLSPYVPVGLLASGIVALEIIMLAVALGAAGVAAAPVNPDLERLSNTEAIGRVLYTEYAIPFQTAGLILLVAMIGAIVLTLRGHTSVRRQQISAQVSRKPEDVLRINKVGTGEGA